MSNISVLFEVSLNKINGPLNRTITRPAPILSAGSMSGNLVTFVPSSQNNKQHDSPPLTIHQ